MNVNYYLPQEECLPRHDLEALQIKKCQEMLKNVLPSNKFYRKKFKSLMDKIESLQTLDDFREIPFTTKEELSKDQEQYPPYGSNLTNPLSAYTRIHQTSGTTGLPLRWMDTPRSWHWILKCWGIIYGAIGVRPEDKIFFPFSFGPFIGFWAGFEGGQALETMVVAGGGMSSLARVQFIQEHKITLVCCTPTYALRLSQVAQEHSIDLPASAVKGVLVAGEPGGAVPHIRARIEEGWGARVFDHTGMTEIGSLGIECTESPCHTHLIESECIAEVVDYETGKLLQPGETGELVLTNLGRWSSPLIRYRTGDTVSLIYDICDCGRTYCRMIGGIQGRRDQMIIIKGNNIYPAAIENIIRQFNEIEEFQLKVHEDKGIKSLTIEIETGHDHNDENGHLAPKVADTVRNNLFFRPEVALVAKGSLPRFEMKATRITLEK